MALPKLLDDLVSKRIIEAVRSGASRTGAAEAARVSRSTLHLWLQRGEAGDEPYASFTARVREAEGDLERELITIIKGHAVETWTAAAWLAERRWPKRWALRRDRAADSASLTPDEVEKLIAEAAQIHAETQQGKS